MDFLKGWKTVLFNAGLAAGTVLLQWLADYNWVEVVGPELAVVVVGMVNVFLRFVTNTPIFQKD